MLIIKNTKLCGSFQKSAKVLLSISESRFIYGIYVII